LQSRRSLPTVHSPPTPLQTVRELFKQPTLPKLQRDQCSRSIQEYDVPHRPRLTSDQTAQNASVEGSITPTQLRQ